MKYLLSFLYLLMPLIGVAQITSYSPNPVIKVDSIASAPYDSLYTFQRKRLHSLIGQEIQFLPCVRDSKKGHYSWFTLYDKGYIYEKGPLYGTTKYEALVNKKFTIVGVDSIVDDNRYFREVRYRLRVFAPEFSDTMSLSLPVLHDSKMSGKLETCKDFEDFNFRNLIILGYYEKLKQKLINTTVSVKYANNKMPNNEIILYDLATGAPLSSAPVGKKLTVKDIGVIDGMEFGGLCYIFESPSLPNTYATLNPLQFNNALPISKDHVKRQQWEKKMIGTYGKVNGNYIIDGKVKIGFTKQMCKEAWGEPESINTSTGSWGSHEQWVYGLGSYLYFENGRLTAIDN